MSDEFWAAQRFAQRQRRDARLEERTAALLALNKEGFTVRVLTPYCIRINDTIDCYPIHNRWHDLMRQTRGGAHNLNLAQFVQERLRRI